MYFIEIVVPKKEDRRGQASWVGTLLATIFTVFSVDNKLNFFDWNNCPLFRLFDKMTERIFGLNPILQCGKKTFGITSYFLPPFFEGNYF